MSKSFEKFPLPPDSNNQDTVTLSTVPPNSSASSIKPVPKSGRKAPFTKILVLCILLLGLGVAVLAFTGKFSLINLSKTDKSESEESIESIEADEFGLQSVNSGFLTTNGSPKDIFPPNTAYPNNDFGNSLDYNSSDFTELNSIESSGNELSFGLDEDIPPALTVSLPNQQLGLPILEESDPLFGTGNTSEFMSATENGSPTSKYQQTSAITSSNITHSTVIPYSPSSQQGTAQSSSPYSPLENNTEFTNVTDPYGNVVNNSPVTPSVQAFGPSGQQPNQQTVTPHTPQHRSGNNVGHSNASSNVQPFTPQTVVVNQSIVSATPQNHWAAQNANRHLPETAYPVSETELSSSPYQPQQNEIALTSSSPSPVSSTFHPVNQPYAREYTRETTETVSHAYAPSRGRYQLRYARTRHNESGDLRLPNTHGQLWCVYDITPYTKAVGVVPGTLPEQTIIDWIIRQTGQQSWHTEPFGILSANSETLYVYHTPEMQEIVAETVDRFVNPKTASDAFALRIVSLSGPNWMTQGHGYLKPIRIDSPGVNGWLLEKEDQTRLLGELSRRSDYKELASPQFTVSNGRPQIISANIPKNYIRNAQTNNEIWPGYETESAVINEGYTVTFVPLSGMDEISSDVMIRCDILQIEKLNSVVINVPSRVHSRQRVSIEAPQMSAFQLDEQIRWPKDKVLLLDLGTIPLPSAAGPSDAGKLIPEISRRIAGTTTQRGNVLMFVECRQP